VAMHRLKLSGDQRKEVGLCLVKSLVFLFEWRAPRPHIETTKQRFQASSTLAEKRVG
jgi:hypothetical protein